MTKQPEPPQPGFAPNGMRITKRQDLFRLMNSRRTPRTGRLGRAVLLGSAIAAGGCNPNGSASGPVPLQADMAPDWRALVGCYQVEHLRFVLDTVPVVTGWRGRESARQARTLPVGERTGKRFWLVTPRNTLEVVFEDGLWATRLELVVRGDSLVGRRHVYGDQPHVPPSVHPATGVREPCPA